MAEYWLDSTGSRGATLSISREKFESLKTCRLRLAALLDVEQLFSSIALSTFEFEKFLLLCPLEEFFGRFPGRTIGDVHRRMDDISTRVNILMLTLFSAIRAYHDQRRSLLPTAGIPDGICDQIELKFARTFDDFFDYRLMEALRNYTQHNRLPVQQFSIGSRRDYGEVVSDRKTSKSRTDVVFYLVKNDILEHRKKLRSATMSELENIEEEKLELTLILRNYVSLLSLGHFELRRLTENILTDAEELLDITRQEFSRCIPNSVEELPEHLSAKASVSGQLEEHYLDIVLVDKLRGYRASWTGLSRLWEHYISSAVVPDRELYFSERKSQLSID
ncbi:MAG: hypothetical protein AAGH83_06735 [Pseudomonadota bacterium]